MDLCEVTMKYYRLVVLISHDSAEIWGVSYGLILGIGTLKKKPAPFFCVLFVFAAIY
jgi:predicted alpha/beta superfamily hydrolase